MSALGWTPQDGETVHLNPRNRWGLPAGRYQLEKQAGEFNDTWHLRGITVTGWDSAQGAHLREQERLGTLTPISADELARERQEVQLRTTAPLRGNRRGPMRPQHDASDLALFRHANEPRLI